MAMLPVINPANGPALSSTASTTEDKSKTFHEINTITTTTTTLTITTATATVNTTATTTTTRTAINSSPSNKTRSILNWLKSTKTTTKAAKQTKNCDQAEEIYSCNTNQFEAAVQQFGDSGGCTCPTPQLSARRTPTSSGTDETLREFRGVQTLRHLWNKRISASRESALRRTPLSASAKANSFTKSIGCLVKAGKAAQSDQAPIEESPLKQRAHSLHDCFRLEEQLVGDDAIGAFETEIDFLRHREKDNFYKYKTAEQANRQLGREPSGCCATARRLNVGVVRSAAGSTEEALVGPCRAATGVERAERIHWPTRQDVLQKRQERTAAHQPRPLSRDSSDNVAIGRADNIGLISSNRSVYNESDDTTTSTSTTTMTADDHNDNNGDVREVHSSSVPTAQSQDQLVNGSASSAVTAAASCANSPQHLSSRYRVTGGVASATSATSTAKKGTGSAVSGRSARRTSSGSTPRKYSFKTHTRTFHTPRKMIANKDGANGGGGGGGGGVAGGGVVAKLTQQFNELIQRDGKLLEEVKRKNGVLMARGGHVYKVVEMSSLNKSPSPSLSRSSSRAQERLLEKTTTSSTSSTVQRTIRKFESVSKPKVPTKSHKVLSKSTELVLNRSSPRAPPTSGKALNLTLSLKEGKPSSEWAAKKQCSLAISHLDMVTEEAKTPLEDKEKIPREPDKTSEDGEVTSGCRPLDNESFGASADHLEENEKQIPFNGDKIAEAVEATNSSPQQQTLSLADNDGVDNDKSNDDVTVGSPSNPEMANRGAPAHASGEAADALEDVSEDKEKTKQRKYKYAKLYEKFRFRSPFGGAHTKKSLSCSTLEGEALLDASKVEGSGSKVEEPSASKVEGSGSKVEEPSASKVGESSASKVKEPSESKVGESSASKMEESSASKVEESSASTVEKSLGSKVEDSSASKVEQLSGNDLAMYEGLGNFENVYGANDAESRILDALEAVDQKIKDLTVDAERKLAKALNVSHEFEPLLAGGGPVVFQTIAKEAATSSLLVAQAVNVTLVNTIEGEQMIMEQKDLQQQQQQRPVVEAVVCSEDAETNEPLYEPIADTKYPEKTESESATPPTHETGLSAFENWSEIEQSTGASGKCVAPEDDDIYQTVEEAHAAASVVEIARAQPALKQSQDVDDYEVIANPCERETLSEGDHNNTYNKSLYDDGYEECAPPPETSEKMATTPLISAVRNTNDELPELPKLPEPPELPKPQRRLPKSPTPGKRPPKPVLLREEKLFALSGTGTGVIDHIDNDNEDDRHYYADDENIYDTIKGSDCYESLNSDGSKLGTKCPSSSNKFCDTVSLTSNCYESITQYRRVTAIGAGHTTSGSSSGSTLTISSEQRTNSLYEDSVSNGLDFRPSDQSGAHEARLIYGARSDRSDDLPSNAASSDNSDEWIDISDTETNANGDPLRKQQFIVVRERSKAHKSPDWSRRVRDKRLHQKKSQSYIEDDSDHYYEKLSPQDLDQRVASEQLPRPNGRQCSASAQSLGQGVSDDYDSFNTDTDEVYEAEERPKSTHNDSGVDIYNLKPPDPPHPTNQVYAIVRKFKNFIVNKKSPSSSQKHAGSQPASQKIYEDSAPLCGEGAVYQSHTPKQPKSQAKSPKSPPKTEEVYEQHNLRPRTATFTAHSKELSTSERNLLSTQSQPKGEMLSTTTPRSKNKASKSLRSRLRKSLVGSNFDNKQLATLTPTRSTFYIEDPTTPDDCGGELDSGFSEKASSGDLPTVAASASASMTPLPPPESQRFSTVVRKAKKEAKTANAQRRRTTIGIRPHEPPPPPPPAVALRQGRQPGNNNAATTSWYAECGVFKNGSTSLVYEDQQLKTSKGGQAQNGSGSAVTGGPSWYEEAGLYQTSGVSVASSSGSSGVSTGNEAGLGDEVPHSMFLNEPLYQIYTAAKLEAISRDMEANDSSSTDGYEEIGDGNSSRCDVGGGGGGGESRKPSRPTALQLVGPKSGPARTLWCEIPEVINSCILPTLTPRERALQEAKFEIITSEASYLKSLNLLRSHYMNHPVFRDTNVVSSRDRKSLFAHIVPVHECSERLLTELESCWQDNIMLLGLSRRIYAVAEKHFHVYIAFCEQQGRMDRTLKRLSATKGLFSQNLDLLEASPECCGLKLHSFLMLPMQRITRLPLLIDAVFSKCHPNDDEYDNWKMTLAIMNKIVTQCNEAANRCEQAYEIERISSQLEFNPATIRPLAIAPAGVPAPGSKPRFLVKKGELTHLVWRGDDAKLTFGKKITKSLLFAFLFSDLLVLTKRKAEEQFTVIDYCPRNMLTITSGDTSLPPLPTKDMTNQMGKNLILMTLLENHERKTVELVLSCPSVSEQERWLQTMRPPEAETPGEKLYEQWDCPQVIAKHSYEANEPDALNLEIGDVVNVTRKLPDGWYQGERIRDGAVGWFPGSYTEEVNSAHVRARNLKQRHRLLTFTATYLESQKRK